MVSFATAWRHRNGNVSATIVASAIVDGRNPWLKGTGYAGRKRIRTTSPEPEDVAPVQELEGIHEQPLEEQDNARALADRDEDETIAAAEAAAQRSVWDGRTRVAAVEVDEDNESDGEDGGNGDDDELDYEWGTEDYDADEYEAISAWDRLTEDFLRKGMICGTY